MKVWRLGPSGFEPGDQETQALASDEVRVQVEAVCIEPADLALAGDLAPGGGLVGRVIETGDAATAFASARVLVSPVRACGECDSCRRSFATVCPSRLVLGRTIDGGCAESVVASARWLTRLDQGLEVEGPVAALIAGPALTAYALYCRAGISAGELMIVLGQAATAAILAHLGESRGAKVIRESGPEAASKVTAALQEIDSRAQPHRIFVCDGENSLATALEFATPGSMIVSLQQAGTLDVAPFVDRELSLLGLSFGHPDLMPETAALVAKGELDLSSFLHLEAIKVATHDAAAEASERGQCLVLSHESSTS